MQLDELMTKSIIQIESYYVILIYKYLFDCIIAPIVKEDLPFAFAWFLDKIKHVFEALQKKEATMYTIEKEINKEQGEHSILFDFIACFCGISEKSIIKDYTPKPDEQNYQEQQERTNDFCDNMKWAMGRIIQEYMKIVNSMASNEPIQKISYPKDSIN